MYLKIPAKKNYAHPPLQPPHSATPAAAVTESGERRAVVPSGGWQTSGCTQKERENTKSRATRMRPVFLTRLTQL